MGHSQLYSLMRAASISAGARLIRHGPATGEPVSSPSRSLTATGAPAATAGSWIRARVPMRSAE